MVAPEGGRSQRQDFSPGFLCAPVATDLPAVLRVLASVYCGDAGGFMADPLGCHVGGLLLRLKLVPRDLRPGQ